VSVLCHLPSIGFFSASQHGCNVPAVDPCRPAADRNHANALAADQRRHRHRTKITPVCTIDMARWMKLERMPVATARRDICSRPFRHQRTGSWGRTHGNRSRLPVLVLSPRGPRALHPSRLSLGPGIKDRLRHKAPESDKVPADRTGHKPRQTCPDHPLRRRRPRFIAPRPARDRPIMARPRCRCRCPNDSQARVAPSHDRIPRVENP